TRSTIDSIQPRSVIGAPICAPKFQSFWGDKRCQPSLLKLYGACERHQETPWYLPTGYANRPIQPANRAVPGLNRQPPEPILTSILHSMPPKNPFTRYNSYSDFSRKICIHHE